MGEPMMVKYLTLVLLLNISVLGWLYMKHWWLETVGTWGPKRRRVSDTLTMKEVFTILEAAFKNIKST